MNPEPFVRTLPNGRVLQLPGDISSRASFKLMEVVSALEDGTNQLNAVAELKGVIPPEFFDQTDDLPQSETNPILMEWIQMIARRMGKALTPPQVSSTPAPSSQIGPPDITATPTATSTLPTSETYSQPSFYGTPRHGSTPQ